jgi:predicted dehydrogenase
LAASLAEGMEILRLAKEAGVPCFSSSMLRFSAATQEMRKNPKIGDVVGCVSYSPCTLEEHHPDLYYYGIHGVEILFTIMGPGCASVVRTHTPDTDVVTGVWRDGRVGTFCGQRKAKADFGALVFGSKGTQMTGPRSGYDPLLLEVAKFFETRKPPVSADETLEILAFMDAADESKRQGGVPVTLESIRQRAKTPSRP